MFLIRRIEITNFVCFDNIEIEPSTSNQKPLTVVRAENGSGKTTLLRAIRWGMYGEKGLPKGEHRFSIHPAWWQPDQSGIETKVVILFETDGSTRNIPEGKPTNTMYELSRSVTTISQKSSNEEGDDFRRINEETQLIFQELDGSWIEYSIGVDSVVEELLPSELEDFFIMDADKAADYVGGSENIVVDRRSVIAMTSTAVGALLGLDVFKDATDRLRRVSDQFGQDATKAIGTEDINRKQDELNRLTGKVKEKTELLEFQRHKLVELEDNLKNSKGYLETLIGNLGAYDQLKLRLQYHNSQIKEIHEERLKVAGQLSSKLDAIELLASLVSEEISRVRDELQPLYDDGSIPAKHLVFVQGLIDSGICVCGRDLSLHSEFREKVQAVIDQSSSGKAKANYLAEVLHAANALHQYRDGGKWESERMECESTLANIEDKISDLKQEKRDVDNKLNEIDDVNVGHTRSEIQMLTNSLDQLKREIERNQNSLNGDKEEKNRIQGVLQSEHKRQREAREYRRHQETANTLVEILDHAYAQIRDNQVAELSAEMNNLFSRMAANVSDDDSMEDGLHKANLRMIERVGLKPLEHAAGEYEIFAHNSRGRSMQPTEINGASRRILALSFVLGLCKVSGTRAPLIADSLLNFTSGLVRTNTLRVTAETASQPILLLTYSDVEAETEVDLVRRYANVTYTLTGQWQHTSQGGDVVNQTDARKVSLICDCGPREYCRVCERQGQSENKKWTMRRDS